MNWTGAKIQEAARMRRAGRPYSAIAAQMGVSRSALLGMAKRNRALFPLEEARPARKAPEKPQKAAGRPRFVWDDARRKRAAALRRAGQTVRAISRALGCSPAAVTKMMKANPALFPPRLSAKPAARHAPARAPKRGEKPAPTVCDLSQYRLAGVQPKTLLTVEDGECRFPLASFGAADGPELPVCGAPVAEGQSWCAAHCRNVFEGGAAQ